MKVSKRERFVLWLDNIIEPIPFKENNPNLNNSGIEFFEFHFKKDISMYMYEVTPYLIEFFEISEENKHKYIIDISGKKAFHIRICKNIVNSPVLTGEFVKFLQDKNWIHEDYFSYIKSWVKIKMPNCEFEK